MDIYLSMNNTINIFFLTIFFSINIIIILYSLKKKYLMKRQIKSYNKIFQYLPEENNNDNFTSKNNMDNIIDKFIHSYSISVKTPYIIGICGGSGSGKTFITNLIKKTIKKMFPNSKFEDIIILSQDSYYRGGNSETNYDIPTAIDFCLLEKHLIELMNGNSIECPVYDFTTHSRKKETIIIHPGKIIIVEGILILTREKLRSLLNMKIFINADEPTQIFRRAIRDIKERGRTIEEVRMRYERDVWPSYKEYVLPSSKYADMSINNFNDCYVGPQIALNHIITILRNIYQD